MGDIRPTKLVLRGYAFRLILYLMHSTRCTAIVQSIVVHHALCSSFVKLWCWRWWM